MKINPAVASPSALLVKLADRPDFTAVERMPRGADRKAAAWDAIVQTAERSQAPFLERARQLERDGIIQSFETLASPNMLVLTPAPGKTQGVMNAFRTDGVKAIYGNDGFTLWQQGAAAVPPPRIIGEPNWGLDVVRGAAMRSSAPAERPYGVDMVGAPAAWAQGATGAGLVFGSIDTGVDYRHEALAANYRGAGGKGRAQHDHNWMDLSGARPSQSPADTKGHGTHTTGTVVGAGVGVAPKAQWIAVNGLAGTADAALKALTWMQAPTRLDGSAPDPAKAPDVVGMSWWLGRATQDLFLESVQNLRAAGIEPVKSAGNQGPGGGTITSPGQFPELYAVGAVDANGKVATFSSRGPAPYPKGSTTPKPDFAAPGVDVVSSLPNNRYGKNSGTSMAQPHMSGAVLAVLSKYPELTHEQLTDAFRAGARDAGKPGTDAEYGAGIIDLPATLAAAQDILEGARLAA